MNLFEYENERFGNDLWTEETIAECRKSKPLKRSDYTDIFWDADADEKYIEYQEANWNEYFDFAKTYKYCLFR